MYRELLNSLMGTGQQMMAPTRMEDIKVPQMPLEPGGIAPAVGANVAANLPETMSATPSISQGLLNALAVGGVNGLFGGGGEQEQRSQMISAPRFQGAALFDNPGAQAFSGKVVGAPNLRGLLGG